MSTLTTPYRTYDLFVALDVDKNSYAVTVNDAHNIERSKKMPANPESFYNYIQKTYPDKRALFAYEAGPTGYGLHDYLASKEQRCLVISPNAIPKASNDKVKTNRLDSKRLSELVKAGVVDSIRVPDESFRDLRHLVNTRQDYVKKQIAAKQRIESLLLFQGLHNCVGEHKRWSRHHLKILEELSCSPAVRERLNALLDDLNYARTKLLYFHKVIKEFCAGHPHIQKNIDYIRSIPGIGFVTSTYVLSRIGDPSHLKNVRELGAFAGVVPTEHSTGETIHKGHITHMGNETMRHLLVEAAWIAIRKDPELGFFYNRIKNRHPHSGGAQIAIVAVARKLTHRIHKVLKEQRMYVVL